MRQIRTERVSAKDVKKRSDYQSKYERPDLIIIPKDRIKTATGFTSAGYAGSNFEIMYEILGAGASTATFFHPKKDRVIHLLSGVGLYHTEDGNYVKILAGEDVTVPAGTKYHLSAETDLYLMLIQPSKFTANLEVDASTEVTVDMENRIDDVPNAPVTPTFTRGPSKAAQLLAEVAANRNQRLGEETPRNEAPEPKPAALGSAPMPGFGNDLIGEPG